MDRQKDGWMEVFLISPSLKSGDKNKKMSSAAIDMFSSFYHVVDESYQMTKKKKKKKDLFFSYFPHN